MLLIDELRREHDLIEAVAGSLRTYAAERAAGRARQDDGPRFIEFLTVYAGHFHHAREEDTLFAALVARAGLPPHGPIAVLLDDHARLAALLDRIRCLIEAPLLTAVTARDLEDLTRAYAHHLWSHIDAENSVLLPESDARLRKSGVAELPSRPMTVEERAAMEIGRELIAAYPPILDIRAPRGDGCVCCPAMGETCRGLEHEWWSEWEWEELEDHLAEG